MHIKKRDYRNYAEYLNHQASKLRGLDLGHYEAMYREELGQRMRNAVEPGTSVLCLGARLGAEVRAFIDGGCFAIGLDVNPGAENRFVVRGDFHSLQFASDSVDVVFTNSLDHVFDFGKFIGEVKRVLKPGGLFALDIVRGVAEGWRPDDYDCFMWDRIEDVLSMILQSGFRLITAQDIESPWPGQHIVLRHTK